MKITGVRTYCLHVVSEEDPAMPWEYNWLLVKVITDSGLVGWGEASVEGQMAAVEACVHALAERSVIGEDPRHIEKIWRQMYHHGFWKGGFIHMSAISGIDIALWDLAGKIYDTPTHMLLGGPVRDRIRTYTHAYGGEMAAKYVEMGFAGVKTGGSPYGVDVDEMAAPDYLEASLADIRDHIGPEALLMVDQHGQMSVSAAVRQLEAARPFNLYFFEEPVPPENFKEYLGIRAAAGGVPLAAGERLFSRWDCRGMVENQLVDFLQPDICHCGGISEIRRIAVLAEVYHIRFAPHNPYGPVGTAASLQVALATQNFAILEFAAALVLSYQDLYSLDLKPVDGFFRAPTGPGLGIEIDEARLAEIPRKEALYRPRYLVDGTVAEI